MTTKTSTVVIGSLGVVGVAAILCAVAGLVSRSLPHTAEVRYVPPKVQLDPPPPPLPIELEWRAVLVEKGVQ